MKHFSDSLPMMLYRSLDVVMPRFRKIFREAGLTEQQWRILRVLWERNDLLSRELAELALIPTPSLVGVVDRLENRNLVSRRRDSIDRRNVFIRITEEGQDLKEQITPRIDAVYFELQRSVDPVVWKQLQHGLECICRTSKTRIVRTTAANK